MKLVLLALVVVMLTVLALARPFPHNFKHQPSAHARPMPHNFARPLLV